MISVSEMVCTDLQNAPVAEKAQGAEGGAPVTGELFAALLAALSAGLLASQDDASVVIGSGEQAAQSDVCIESGVAVQSDGAVQCNVSAGGVSVADAAVVPPETVAPPVAGASGGARGSPTQGKFGWSVQRTGEPAPVQPVPAADDACGVQTVMSAQSGEGSLQLDCAGDPDAEPADGVAGHVSGLTVPEQAGSADVEVVRAAPNASAGAVAKVPVHDEAGVGSQGGAQPAASGESSSASSGLVVARVGSERGGEESVSTGTQQDAESGGSKPGSGATDRLFFDTLAHAQDGRVRGTENITNNEASLVRNSGEARLTESIVEQTVRSVLLSARGGSSELRVRLQPEHLGELHLRLVVRDNVLTLDVNTQSAVVKTAIEGSLSQLRQALQGSGVDIGRVSVMVDPDLASGGRFSRQTPTFQQFQDQWGRSCSGQQREEEPSLTEWFRGGARRRHLLCRIDVIA